MNFVDRTEEPTRIRKILSANKAGFIVVYGCRRCGKTTLLRRVLKGMDIYFMADQTKSTQQIVLLAQTITIAVPGFYLVKYLIGKHCSKSSFMA